MPEWLIGHMLAIARGGAEGAFTAEHTTPVRDVVGRAPITTRQFVQITRVSLTSDRRVSI
jgi:hypothetical protein